MRKRIWAVLLTICMLVGLLPTTALAGGLTTVKTYAKLVEALQSQTGEIYLEPAADFGWPDTGTLSIPANTQIVVIDENEQKAPWAIPNGITVNFEQNTHGISCSTLTVNGTMHKTYSSQGGLDFETLVIGPTGVFSCEDDREDYPTVASVYIAPGETLEVQEGANMNARVRLDGTLTGKGTVSGQVQVSGGYGGTSTNATLSGDLTLTGGLIVGYEYLDSYADQLTIPAGSHIKSNSWTTISHATVYLNGVVEWERVSSEYSANANIAAGGKIVMDGGKLIFNTPCKLSQAVFEWEDGEVMTYERVRDNITEPLVDGTGVIRFNDKVSATGEEYGRIMDCDADLVARTAQQVRAGTYDVEDADALTWEPYYAIALENIAIERSWACDHTWDDGVVTTAPTCTQPGVKTYTCTQCQTTRTEEMEATGHTAVTDDAVAATCTTTGLTEGSHCSVCEEVLVAQEVISALGHTSTESDCTKQDVCAVCKEVIRDAGQHAWGDWTVTKAATCTEDGSQSHTCTSCNTSENEDIPKLGHSCSSVVTAPTCTEKGYTTHTCSRCGDNYVDTYVDALGHAWNEGVITTPPTLDADGVKTYTCQRCSETITETIPKLAQQEVSWTPAGPVTVTYGTFSYVQPTAYNESVEDCLFSYSSSDPSVATVDANGKTSIVGAGTAIITATAPAVPGQYAETSASYTLVVNKAELTVTANNHTITYGQAPTYNGYAVTGLVNGDSESVLTGTAAYNCEYEQYRKAGNYDITLSGLSAKNYDITFEKGTLTVEKAKDYTITLGKLEQVAGYTSAVSANVEPYDATAQIKVEYQFNNQWTENLPTEEGKYNVRARLIASENIELDDDDVYTDGTLMVKKGITVDPGQGVDNVEINVNVTDNKVSLVVTDANQITDKANGDVKINIGGVSGAKELELPGDLMTVLSQNEKADSLTVTTEDASISMSSAVLDTVASAITGGEDTVAVKLTAVEKNDLNEKQQEALAAIAQDAVIVEVSLIITHADNSSTELHELGGKVEITVPYAGSVPDGKYIVVSYVSNDGGVSYVRATYNKETKQVSFSTNHFSNYALFLSGQNTYDVTIEGGSGSGTYLEGSTVTIKADSKSGYTFAEWKVVSGDVKLADAKAAETTFTMPAANVELKATYTKITSGGGGGISAYTLTFDTNGGSKIASVSKASGTAIDLTGYVPARAGYDFDGWYADAKLTDKITSVNLTKNMTVYAKWTEKDGENPFTDVSGDAYYADAVIWAVGEGITSGTTATTFTPDNPCTRAQAVTFLWRAAGSPVVNNAMNFSDVSADAYYAEAVRWAVSQGITMGTSDTAFSPNATCTRAQIVTFLWRSQQSPAADGVNPFTDVAADAYYANAVLWAAENGITGGTTATTFSPNNDCTRAQSVTFLYRAFAD